MSRPGADPPTAATLALRGDEVADAGLLQLVAGLAGLDAVVLVVAADDRPTVRASWPVQRAGVGCDDSTEAGRSRLLIAAGGAGGGVVTATASVDAGVVATVHGSLVASGGVSPGEAGRTLTALVPLVASHLGADIARRHAEDVQARMASLVDASLALGQELSLDALLTRIVQSAREVLGARYAALGVLDATRTELAEFVVAGLEAEEVDAIGELPRGRGLLGVLIRDARPLRLERMADDPRSEGFPPHHPPMRSFLGVPIALRGEVFGNLYLTDKAGGPFTAEDEQMALTFASQAAVAVDNVRRYEAERRRANELESVQEIARAALATLDLDALLPLVARRARRLIGADTIGVAVSDGHELVFRYAHGIDALGLEGSRGPADLALLRDGLSASLGSPAVEVCALEVSGEIAGALVAVGWRPFDDHARRLLETFSSQVAIALVNARAVTAERQHLREVARGEAATARERAQAEGLRRVIEAQEAERTRIARELHDEAGQVLTALALHLRALEDDVDSDAIRDRLVELRRSVGEASTGIRDLAVRLRPPALTEHGLIDAIEEQAARLRAAGPPVDVALSGIGPHLPEAVQTVLFRVVQEALTNAARHSGATNVSVVSSAHRGRLRLVVEDDGAGFDPATPTERLGLAGLRERVETIGGRLRIESSPGAGTAVVVDVDLPS